jgi:uncharacterized protein (TIGR02246 family)
LLTTLLGFLALPAARAGQAAEDAAIHQRSDEWNATWNKHDAKAMAEFFVADGDRIKPFGRQAHRQAEIDSIRYIGKTVAIVDVSGEITGMKGPDGAAAPPFKHHVTWIAQKKAGKWMAQAARAFALLTPTPAK